MELKDCFQLGSSHWYGGPEVSQQNWPIEGQSRDEEPYVTGDSLSTSHCGSVLEPYWINSQGFAIYASRDNPLFVSFNSTRFPFQFLHYNIQYFIFQLIGNDL